jgi:hypothetical protein
VPPRQINSDPSSYSDGFQLLSAIAIPESRAVIEAWETKDSPPFSWAGKRVKRHDAFHREVCYQ